MFAVLGEIPFEVLGSPETFESSRGWDYAEHRVVEGQPRLQWVADGLETISLDLKFHAFFTNPALQLAALSAAAEDHNARALVFGSGEHRGYFVVTSLATTSTQTSAAGDPTSITVRLTLKELALEAEIASNAPMRPTFPVVGIVLAPAGSATGVAAAFSPSGATSFTASSPSAAPGISSILSNPSAIGATTSLIIPDDVSPQVIVRAAQ